VALSREKRNQVFLMIRLDIAVVLPFLPNHAGVPIQQHRSQVDKRPLRAVVMVIHRSKVRYRGDQQP
jgi:hypothetical protein